MLTLPAGVGQHLVLQHCEFERSSVKDLGRWEASGHCVFCASKLPIPPSHPGSVQTHSAEVRAATPSSAPCSLSNRFSVVGQSMQGSVIDIPYSSLLKSFGIDWLPAFKWLSSISPTMERLPSTICVTQFSATSGCRSASLFELP